ncbi:hypothetical protein [Mariniflexile sp. AS56]|nr:hypothetical protein [Mariniflexile sp. AS56]MDO7172667.1 hypothetical protein [Mariniflexile sp. AS56]
MFLHINQELDHEKYPEKQVDNTHFKTFKYKTRDNNKLITTLQSII